MTDPQAVTQVHNSRTQPPKVSWREALKFWWWLGCMSFGGPAGQIALMHEELVVRRRWMSEKRYLHALNYCMLLPGPEAQQLATYMGWLMHGTRGGIAAGALFVLPSLVLLIVLSWAYTAWGQHPWGQALLWGLKPAVTALVLQAAHRLALRTLKARWLWVLAVLALLGMLWGLPVAVIILVAAATGYVLSRQTLSPPDPDAKAASPTPASNSAPAWLDDDTPPPPHTHYSHPRLVRALAIGVGLWALSLGLIALVFGLGHTLTHMGGFFTQAALLTFGGAYAVLPFVTHAAVSQYGWVTAAQTPMAAPASTPAARPASETPAIRLRILMIAAENDAIPRCKVGGVAAAGGRACRCRRQPVGRGQHHGDIARARACKQIDDPAGIADGFGHGSEKGRFAFGSGLKEGTGWRGDQRLAKALHRGGAQGDHLAPPCQPRDAMRFRQPRQLKQFWRQFLQHAFARQSFVARMQRRQLHRNPRIGADVVPLRRRRNRRDGL